MKKIEITDNELSATLAFLSRTDIKGAEAPAMARIMGALSNAAPLAPIDILTKKQHKKKISK